MIAALFVETKGCYQGLYGVDPWDIERDATRYAGPWSVVAHPPCARWCQLAMLNQSRYQHVTGWTAKEDGGLFAFALQAVNRYGGVLEHPAFSLAWEHYGLTKPTVGKWTRCLPGWVCQVDQSVYGHRARKRTWLYYQGSMPPFDLNWDHQRGTHGWSSLSSTVKEMGKRERRETPVRFRDALLDLAIHATR